jgi:hypothetical protein
MINATLSKSAGASLDPKTGLAARFEVGVEWRGLLSMEILLVT